MPDEVTYYTSHSGTDSCTVFFQIHQTLSIDSMDLSFYDYVPPTIHPYAVTCCTTDPESGTCSHFLLSVSPH